MGFKRIWSATGVVALAGALLLTAAPVASADYVRDQQWVLDVFAMNDTWAETQGEGVTVAVVDSGVDTSHPDLAGQVLEGKDFTGGGNAQKDLDGHGTSMASLIAGHGHGSGKDSGMVGLAPKSKILPLRVIQTQKDPNHDETWAAAVRYAVDQGAKVINLSFSNDGGKTLSDGRAAISYAQAHDVVVVASAGNDGSVAVDEPAALPGVVSVGAVDKDGNRWEGSNTGKGLTLMAPGAQILAADPTRSQQYSLSNGTSGATAYVSATAALVRSKYPDLSAGQVINRLIKSASFLGHKGLKAPDEEYGYGVIRPRQAVTMDIPAGPKTNPLGQLTSSVSSQSSKGTDSTAAKKKKSSSSNLVLIGGIAAVVIIGVIAFVLIRSRRNGGNGGPGSGGGSPQNPTYPPTQQPYNSAPNQGYPAPPGQYPQHPNSYSQQPPHQGQ
ncbi:type VII secretion-associated serine protease mycosin [Streptomyces chartreusis]|uniref:type VII secretion-associated serine protease mycosin n=1 Tax=Streptomyces chartreusis TaxID=1969 RepID=UPI002101518C|nr:type VII secretion-associated serine protease mycosin [Streptomyces chartreusis]